MLPIMECDLDIDALGLLCPLPVLRLKKRIADLPQGSVVCLRADDPAAAIDVPHFCNEAGHEFLRATEAPNGTARYFLKTR